MKNYRGGLTWRESTDWSMEIIGTKLMRVSFLIRISIMSSRGSRDSERRERRSWLRALRINWYSMVRF